MPLNKDILQLTGIFVIQMILLGFAIYYLLLGAHLHSAIFLGTILPLFIFMILKGKKMKEEYPEEYE